MKRIICALTSAFLMLNLIGCNHANETNSDQTGFIDSYITENSTQTGQIGNYSSLPTVAVSLPPVIQSESAADETELFRYVYQNIHPVLPDQAVADRIIIDFLNRTGKTETTAEEIFALAKADYQEKDNWNPYLCQLLYQPMRLDEGVLSLYGSYAIFNGGIHPETAYSSVNYDLMNGNVLTFNNILSENADIRQLEQKIINALDLQKEEKYLYPDFETAVKERLSGNDENWFFTQNGVCFYFSPYEIAPYSSGVIFAEVSYDKLSGILNNAYFPAEREIANGTIGAENFDDTSLEKYESFTEIIIQENSNKILFSCDATVYDIRIEQGVFSESAREFTAERTVYAAYCLTPGDTIYLEADLSKDPADFLLSYSQGENTVRYLLTLTDNKLPVLLPA